jgi:hypothetical protein
MWPLGVYFALVLLLVAGMLVVSYLLGQRHHQRSTGEPYEGGILSEGSARVRLSAKFYLVAMFFVARSRRNTRRVPDLDGYLLDFAHDSFRQRFVGGSAHL